MCWLLCFYVFVQCFFVGVDVFCVGDFGTIVVKTFHPYLVDNCWFIVLGSVCLKITSQYFVKIL